MNSTLRACAGAVILLSISMGRAYSECSPYLYVKVTNEGSTRMAFDVRDYVAGTTIWADGDDFEHLVSHQSQLFNIAYIAASHWVSIVGKVISDSNPLGYKVVATCQTNIELTDPYCLPNDPVASMTATSSGSQWSCTMNPI